MLASVEASPDVSGEATWEAIPMTPLQQTDVMSTNLHMLSAIRLGLERDRVAASCRFALDAALADRLCALGQDELWALVTHMGQNTLFPPRHDLLALLQVPMPLTGPIAAVHPLRAIRQAGQRA
jgi:hypothetical protein